nr:MFS transporter [Alteribacter aurantiacus]
MKLLWTNKNFLKLFLGRLVTNIGDSLYTIAAMWLVYDLGGSTLYTGLAGFLTMLPRVLQFLTGPIVDKYDFKKILVITQVVQFVLVLSIPFLYYLGHLSITLILIIMPILTASNQFVYPAQSALLPRIVKSKELVNANSLFSFAFQGVDIVATSVGGILITLMGAITLYLIDSLTFLVAILLFATLKLHQKNRWRNPLTDR